MTNKVPKNKFGIFAYHSATNVVIKNETFKNLHRNGGPTHIATMALRQQIQNINSNDLTLTE